MWTVLLRSRAAGTDGHGFRLASCSHSVEPTASAALLPAVRASDARSWVRARLTRSVSVELVCDRAESCFRSPSVVARSSSTIARECPNCRLRIDSVVRSIPTWCLTWWRSAAPLRIAARSAASCARTDARSVVTDARSARTDARSVVTDARSFVTAYNCHPSGMTTSSASAVSMMWTLETVMPPAPLLYHRLEVDLVVLSGAR